MMIVPFDTFTAQQRHVMAAIPKIFHPEQSLTFQLKHYVIS